MFGNGNLLGKRNTTSTFSASGMWGMSEQASAKNNGLWIGDSFIERVHTYNYDGTAGDVFGTTSTMSLGAEAPSRKTIICVGWLGAGATTTPTFVRVNGLPTSVFQAPLAAAIGDGASAIAYMSNTTGTTASVQFSFPSSVSKIYAAVYSVINTTSGTVYGNDSQTRTLSPLDTTTSGAKGSILVSCAMSDVLGSTWSWTGSNILNIAEDVYINPSNTARMSVALGRYIAAGSATITATNANNDSDVSMTTLVLDK